MTCDNNIDALFLGFDLSTQQLKIVVTTADLSPLKTYFVDFDSAFGSKYGTKAGVLSRENGMNIVSPVAMWLEAIDHVMIQMKQDGFPFHRVVAICGSGQQHGSIYWSREAADLLSTLDANSKDLATHLACAFSLDVSPNWQDRLTHDELVAFEKSVGGPENLAGITGSRAHYRFTGLQIRRVATKFPRVYEATDRISLVLSFLASVLLGKIAPLDESDACGMNLYDIKKHCYDPSLLAMAAGAHTKADGVSLEELAKAVESIKHKLGSVEPVGYCNIGTVSKYFVEKYGFPPTCKIYPFTGDNLATIASLPLEQNDCLVLLGTSTTVLLVTKTYEPLAQYHMFLHPTMPDHYMGMICYSNGALAREKVRDALNEKSHSSGWDAFSAILDKSFDTPSHKLGIYFPHGEIVPNARAQTVRAILKDGKVLNVESGPEFTVEDDVRAIIESQTLSCRLRTGPMLISSELKGSENDVNTAEILELLDMLDKFGKTIYTDGKAQSPKSLMARPHRCYYVGGGANNPTIVKKMGSILGPISGNYKVDIANACAMGGSIKASWSFECEARGQNIPYDGYVHRLFKPENKLEIPDQWEQYFTMMGMLATMEQHLQ